MGRPKVLYWFRTDLRLHDSPALQSALSLEPEYLWPIWCFDPYFVYHGVRVGPNQWRFLYGPSELD
jgi:cryptochrome